MLVKIVSFKKESNRYTDIVLASEDGQKRVFKSTAELTLALSNASNVEYDNFQLNPFHLTASGQTKTTDDTKDDNSDIKEIKQMLQNMTLPAVTDEARLRRIEAELAYIHRKLDDTTDAQNMKEYIEENFDKITKYLSEKIDPMYDTIINTLYAEVQNRDKKKFTKCSSDDKEWRYEALPKEALNFVAKVDDMGNVVFDERLNTEQAVKNAFSGINNATSNLTIPYNSAELLTAQKLVKTFDDLRLTTEEVLDNDANVTKNKSIESSSDKEVNLMIGAYSSAFSYILKGADEILKCQSGGLGVLSMLTLSAFNVIKTEAANAAIDLGNKYLAVNARGKKLPTGTHTKDSLYQIPTNHMTWQDIKTYMFNSCKIMTINRRKAFIKGTVAEIHASRRYAGSLQEIKNSDCYEYIKHTVVTSVVYDVRLYLTFLRYCQQPYFGFNAQGQGKQDMISGNEQKIREFLFDRLQNAYFTAKTLLYDCNEPNMIEKGKRLDWLDATNWVGTAYGYDRNNFKDCQDYLHIEKFLEYLKIGLCMQNLSPLCADKLIQIFCNYGKINWSVDTDVAHT